MGFVFLSSMFVLLMLFFKPFPCQQQQPEPNSDAFFLSEFFDQMGISSPSSIYNLSASVCSWRGVFCNENGAVSALIASSFALSGSIPDSTIGKLDNLKTLDISSNKITSLPSDFWSLTFLTSLNLSSNRISGSVTNNLGNFGRLEVLDLSNNNFSGEIPAAISSLSSLNVLKLDRNGFQGKIPVGILQCSSLTVIDLSLNNLSGSLPEGFSAAFPKMETLNLAGNSIEGRDSDLLGLKSAVSLNISGNLFHGSVMGLFLEILEVLDLSRNSFQGHISQVQLNLSNLIHLDLSENQLSGNILPNLSRAHKLKYLNLAFNRFSKQKFPKIDLILQLEYLNLSKTGLIGHVPSVLVELGSLQTLDLSENHLTGSIPSLSVNNLKFLDFSVNNLSGEIPLPLLEKLPLMESFNFSYNNLTFCASEFSPETVRKQFFGSENSCPIAANPKLFKRKGTEHKGMKLALALTFSMVCLIIGLLFLAVGCRRKSSKWAVKHIQDNEKQNISGPFSFQTDSTTWVADVKQATSVQVVIFEKPLLNVTFADLLSATTGFDRGTLLAEGKFGPVYRVFLPGGIHVAVKVLVRGSTLTDQEAARELEYLGRIKHPNLVPLTGYCIAGDQRIAIYEYMENGNLQHLLHDLPLGIQTTEDWSTDTWEGDENNDIQNVGSEGLLTTWRFRHKIALGVARALAFLHHGCSPPLIHRDVKASSVYLDYNLEPRLSDFGLAKMFGNGLDHEIARGSPGYVPPEFVDPGGYSYFDSPTPKSDVYCFGIVLFEIITGKKPIEDDYPDEKDETLVSWVRGLSRKNRALIAIDPKIRDTGPEHEMEEALKIGYLCTADDPAKRPSMQQIVGLLKDIEPKGQQ